MSAGPLGCDGIPERPPCKYPARYPWLIFRRVPDVQTQSYSVTFIYSMSMVTGIASLVTSQSGDSNWQSRRPSVGSFTIFITKVTKLRDKLKLSRQKVKRVILPGKFSRAVPRSQWVWPYSVSLSMLARHVAPVAVSASSVARTLKRRLGQAYSLFVYDVGLQLLYRPK